VQIQWIFLEQTWIDRLSKCVDSNTSAAACLRWTPVERGAKDISRVRLWNSWTQASPFLLSKRFRKIIGCAKVSFPSYLFHSIVWAAAEQILYEQDHCFYWILGSAALWSCPSDGRSAWTVVRYKSWRDGSHADIDALAWFQMFFDEYNAAAGWY
jgi:hypothetical protein